MKIIKQRKLLLSVLILVTIFGRTSSSVWEKVIQSYDIRSSCSIEKAPVKLSVCDNETNDLVSVQSGKICHKMASTEKGWTSYKCVYGRWLHLRTGKLPGHKLIKRDDVSKTIVKSAATGAAVGTAIAGPVGTFIGGAVGGIVGGIKCLFGACDDGPPPNKPPSIRCPSVSNEFYARSGDTYAIVTWDMPSASDPEDGSIGVKLVSGQNPGSKFSRGFHTISYTASDPQGLKDFCHFSFEVQVHVCPPAVWPGNGYVYCDRGEVIEGTSCMYHCNEGFELNGLPKLTCLENEIYSGTPPSCVRIKCPDNSTRLSPENGDVVCTDVYYGFRSVCSTQCHKGYGLSSFFFSQCTENKTWSANLPSCVDTDPPEFIECPSTIREFANRGKDTATVTWSVPIATDKSDDNVTVAQTMGQRPGTEFATGLHEIRYNAIDREGNESPDCIFFVIVEKIMCDPPRIEDPYMNYKCSDGYRYGSSCQLSCRGSFPLIGNNTITCEKNQTNGHVHGYWEWDRYEKQYCKQNPCPELLAPANGALTCDKWMFGTMCMMQCNRKFDLPLSGSYGRIGFFNGQFSCSLSSGKWSPDTTNGIPGCTARRNPRFSMLPGTFYYYVGSCSDPSTQKVIKMNFIQRVKQMQQQPGWQGVCPNDKQCNVDNVEVKCGEVTSGQGRKKRLSDILLRRKRETKYQIEVSFDIKTEWIESGITPFDSYVNTDSILQQLGGILKTKVKEGFFDVGNDTIDKDSVQFSISGIECEPGRFPKYSTLTCGACPLGTYLNKTISECVACPDGTYKDDQDAQNCTPCPNGTSTVNIGSQNETDCLDICEPGYYSITGLEPCLPCPVSTYQSHSMSNECTSCPKTKTTAVSASLSESDCRDFDVIFKTDRSSVDLKKENGVLVNMTLVTWIKLPQNNALLNITYILDGKMIFSAEIGERLNVLVFGNMVDTHIPMDTNVWQQIGISIMSDGKIIRLYKDGELAYKNYIDCIENNDTIADIVDKEAKMTLQTKRNGGVQMTGFMIIPSVLECSEIASMMSWCGVGWNNTVLSMEDFKTADVQSVEFNVPSDCDVQDDCIPDPCNGHLCVDKYQSFHCVCSNGYRGENCEIKPDYCHTHNCLNGATCTNGDSKYLCDCPAGYKGYFCEIKITDGNWTDWSDWSGCTHSCGGGSKTRTRQCDDPPPDPEGLPCVGNGYSHDTCNNQDCPRCPDLPPSIGTDVSCIEHGENIQCVVICQKDKTYNPGFQQLEIYKCGPDTTFEWNGLPQSCSRVKSPDFIKAEASLQYDGAICAKKAEINSEIRRKGSSLQCVKNNTCTIDVELLGCVSNEVVLDTEEVLVLITMTVPLGGGDNLELTSYFSSDTVSEAMLEHRVAVSELSASLQELQIHPEILQLDSLNDTLPNTTISKLIAGCDKGKIQAETFCIDCPPGTFYMEQGTCHPCERGTFKDMTGQFTCVRCPEGFVTPFVGAISKSQCTESNVLEPPDEIGKKETIHNFTEPDPVSVLHSRNLHEFQTNV